MTPEEKYKYSKMPPNLLKTVLKCQPLEITQELLEDEDFIQNYAKARNLPTWLLEHSLGTTLAIVRETGKPSFCVGRKLDPEVVTFDSYTLEKSYNSPGRYRLGVNDQVELLAPYYNLPGGLVGYVEEPGDEMHHDPIVEFPIYDNKSNQLLAVETKGVPLHILKLTHSWDPLRKTHKENFVDLALQAREITAEQKINSDQIISDYIVAVNADVELILVERDSILYQFF